MIALRWAIPPKSTTSWTEPDAKNANPVCLAAITSEWSPNIESAWLATALAVTWSTPGSNSPAILYILGIINSNPWEAVYVVVNAPADNEPCTAPAAPPSDCNSTTLTSCPKIFFWPLAAHSSVSSAIGDDGVIG